MFYYYNGMTHVKYSLNFFYQDSRKGMFCDGNQPKSGENINLSFVAGILENIEEDTAQLPFFRLRIV